MRYLVLALGMIPMTAFAAATIESLQSDVMLFEKALENEEVYQIWSDVDEEVLRNRDLFPEASDENLIVPKRGEKTELTASGFVVVRVNGIPVQLTDTKLSDWFGPYVRDIAEKGIISGYRDGEGQPLGLFGPGDSVTVEQLAKILVEAADVDRSQCEGELKNELAKDTWSEEYILCAEALGWVVYSDGGVDPMREANRSEVVVSVLQAFNVEFPPQASDQHFEDVGPAIQFSGAIEKALVDSLVSGYSDNEGNLTGEFGPYDAVNRAETAKILSLALQLY